MTDHEPDPSNETGFPPPGASTPPTEPSGTESPTAPATPESAAGSETPGAPGTPTQPVAPAAGRASETPTEPISAFATEVPTEPVGTTAASGGATPPPYVPGAAPASGPPPERRSGVVVPVWALVGVGALVLLLVGGLVGYAIGDNSNDGSRATSAPGFNGRVTPFPGFGNGNGGFGNGNGSGGSSDNGRNGGNGNGNGSNGNGNGGNGNGPSAPSGNGAFLGVAVQTSSDPQGAELVTVVPGSSAADAGLRRGDVVTKVDSTAIDDAAALGSAIRSHDVGDEVDVTYTRNGTSKTVTVTLGDRTPSSTN